LGGGIFLEYNEEKENQEEKGKIRLEFWRGVR
jgi:hypothetical protein